MREAAEARHHIEVFAAPVDVDLRRRQQVRGRSQRVPRGQQKAPALILEILRMAERPCVC